MNTPELLAARTIALEHAVIRLVAAYLADTSSRDFKAAEYLREALIAPSTQDESVGPIYAKANEDLRSMVASAERIAVALREAHPPRE